ncbi:MAG: catalase-related domain-containing protein, partial [Gemmatimonadaceae bacterium]
ERYRSFESWERDDLILNLVSALSTCDAGIQQRMIDHFTRCDPEYGNRVAEGLRAETAMPMKS